MFLCLNNPKLWRLKEAVILNLCKITEPRKTEVKS